MYSFVGTFIAIGVSTGIFYYAGTHLSFIPRFSFRECLGFSSLISATDPVSVLSLFKQMNVDSNLYSIVFGESIFNDAIGIVMYREVAYKDIKEDQVAFYMVYLVVAFFVIFVGSILIGAAFALTTAGILKR